MAAPLALAALAGARPGAAQAGAQVEEQLAPSVVAGLQRAIADSPVPADYANRAEVARMARRDVARGSRPAVPDRYAREFLATVHYEATRAGLDPQLVLGVIQHESGFRKYAVSSAERARLHAGDAVLDAS